MEYVKVLGARQLYEALSTKIPRHMEGRILQKALAAGAAPILRAARANARRGGDQFPDVITGTLARSIFSARSKFGNSVTREVRIVSVRKGKRASRRGRDAWYARLVEYGHRTGTRKTGYLQKRGKGSGFAGTTTFVRPQPFMRPAFEANKERAVDLMMAKMRELVDQAARAARW